MFFLIAVFLMKIFGFMEIGFRSLVENFPALQNDMKETGALALFGVRLLLYF